MLEFVLIASYVGALFAAALHAFAHPRGVYWRSAVGAGVAFALATGIWWLGSPVISDAAGLGAFAIWLAVIVLAGVIAIAACIAATLRHALNALGARLL
jgi:hypothetical protein